MWTGIKSQMIKWNLNELLKWFFGLIAALSILGSGYIVIFFGCLRRWIALNGVVEEGLLLKVLEDLELFGEAEKCFRSFCSLLIFFQVEIVLSFILYNR